MVHSPHPHPQPPLTLPPSPPAPTIPLQPRHVRGNDDREGLDVVVSEGKADGRRRRLLSFILIFVKDLPFLGVRGEGRDREGCLKGGG